jgi:hypothetical protein
MRDFTPVSDLLLEVGYPGEVHSLKEFITPEQPMVKHLRYELLSNGQQDAIHACWDWVCKNLKYPLVRGRFRDKHEWNAFGIKTIKSEGEFFLLPFQALVAGAADCFDRTGVLGSLLTDEGVGVEVYGTLGTLVHKNEIDHAWITVMYGGQEMILETTLKEAQPMKVAGELANYEPIVYFNNQVILTKPYCGDLFCNISQSCQANRQIAAACWAGCAERK